MAQGGGEEMCRMVRASLASRGEGGGGLAARLRKHSFRHNGEGAAALMFCRCFRWNLKATEMRSNPKFFALRRFSEASIAQLVRA